MSKDNCCWLCRGPFGRCLTHYACEHHRMAIEDKGLAGRTPYRDPTGNEAVHNVDKERRTRRGRKP